MLILEINSQLCVFTVVNVLHFYMFMAKIYKSSYKAPHATAVFMISTTELMWVECHCRDQ